jgi:hypothetical protein
MMKLREALIVQSPSLALQRAAADEIARQDAFIYDLANALLDVLDGEEVWDIEEISIEAVSIEDMEGVAELTRRLKGEGKVAQVIGMTEMCERVGYHPVHMRNLLKKNTPPIQYAWKANHASGIGWWRFSVEQLDNFKRWLANQGKYPEQAPEIDPKTSSFEQGVVDGEVRMAGAKGNVYEVEDAEYSGPLREW